MNIINHAKYIAEHPFMRQAVSKYNSGDHSDMIHLLFEVQIHLHLKDCDVADRTYRRWKHLNPAEIRKELQGMEAPETLDVKLPFPKVTEVQKPAVFLKKVFNNIKRIHNQLTLWPEVA